MAKDIPTMFELQIEPERLVNTNVSPCWVNLSEDEAREIYKHLHSRFSGATHCRIVVLLKNDGDEER